MDKYFYRVICPKAGALILVTQERWTTKEMQEMYWAAWCFLIRRNQHTIRFDHFREVEQMQQILEQFGFRTWEQDLKPRFIQVTIDHQKFIQQHYQIIGGVIV